MSINTIAIKNDNYDQLQPPLSSSDVERIVYGMKTNCARMMIEQDAVIPYFIIVLLMKNASTLKSRRGVSAFIISLQLDVTYVKYRSLLTDAMTYECRELIDHLVNEYQGQFKRNLVIVNPDTLFAAMSSRDLPVIDLCELYSVKPNSATLALCLQVEHADTVDNIKRAVIAIILVAIVFAIIGAGMYMITDRISR